MENGSTTVCHFLFDRKANKPDTAKKAIENKIEKPIWIHIYTKGLLGYSQLYIPPICRLNMVIGLLAGNKIYAITNHTIFTPKIKEIVLIQPEKHLFFK